jgi:ribonuclease HI
MMALNLVLKLAQEFGVTQLQIFGDSILVIKWMHKEISLKNFTL